MGSGKGKTRRANSNFTDASTTAANIVAASTTPYDDQVIKENPQKWNEFVKTCELQDIKLIQYYLGKNSSAPTNANYGKITEELFADMITSGTITLPNQHSAKNFTFKVENPNARGNWKHMGVALKTKPKTTISVFLIRDHIDKETTMRDISEDDTIYQISSSIQYLLCQQNK
jgi:hypothetical protein